MGGADVICNAERRPGTQALPRSRAARPESFDDLPYLELARRSHRLHAEDDATMADTSDAVMMERFERVETKLDHLEIRFDHLETRFDHLETRFDGLEMRFGVLETRFDGLEMRFGVLETRFDGLEMRFGVLETRFDGLEAKVDGNARRNDIQIEHVRDDIRKLGESFGGVLERIERRLAESQTETNTRLADHELVLRDHGRRITALEPPRS